MTDAGYQNENQSYRWKLSSLASLNNKHIFIKHFTSYFRTLHLTTTDYGGRIRGWTKNWWLWCCFRRWVISRPNLPRMPSCHAEPLTDCVRSSILWKLLVSNIQVRIMFCLCKLHISTRKRFRTVCMPLSSLVEGSLPNKRISHQAIFDLQSQLQGRSWSSDLSRRQESFTTRWRGEFTENCKFLHIVIINIPNRPRLSLFCSIYNISLLVSVSSISTGMLNLRVINFLLTIHFSRENAEAIKCGRKKARKQHKTKNNRKSCWGNRKPSGRA